MLSDYKLLIIEMTAREWNDIIEGHRKIHPELKYRGDEEIETFVKDSTIAYLLHAYVDFIDENKERMT